MKQGSDNDYGKGAGCSPSRLPVRLVRLSAVLLLCVLSFFAPVPGHAQINTERVMAIGRNALYFNDYVLSIQYFNQVIRVKPWLAEPYMFRAIAKMSLEDYQGAEQDCSLALERNPFMIRAYLCRSYARLNLKMFEGAIADCEKGLEFDTENRSLMLNRSIALIYAKRYDEARQDLDELIRRSPRYLFGYMSRGQLCIEMNDTLGAADDFSRAISVDKYYAPAYASRAYVSLLRENYSDAVPDLNEAIRLDPDNEGYYVNRGIARYYTKDYRGVLSDFERVLQLNPASVMTYYNRGLILSEVGDWNKALEDFDKVLSLDPDNDMARYNRALLREQLGDLAGAEEDVTAIIGRYPRFIPAYYQRSDIRRRQGNLKGADKDYFDAWDLDNQRREIEAAGGRFTAGGEEDPDEDQGQGKTRTMSEKDIRKYNRVIVSETDAEQTARYANPIRGRVQNFNVEVEPEPLFVLTYYEQSRPLGLRRAVSLSDWLKPLAGKGIPLDDLKITNMEKTLDAGQVESHFRSIDYYSKMIAENQQQAAWFFARALDFSLVKDIDNALSDLDKALYLQPDFVLACFERATLRFRQLLFRLSEQREESAASMPDNLAGSLSFSEGTFGSDYVLVMQDYDRLAEIAPDFVYAWYNRGCIRCMQKDYRSAIEDYDKAVAISPDFAEAWFNRGITHIYLGEREEGLRDLSRAGELGMYKAYNIIKRFSE
ncbi:MAG: tetratricopeptide repeat protein [Bacteroidales bacterium]|nr:tetratricopeptide repeat protein [Bacteroidales bacterium]